MRKRLGEPLNSLGHSTQPLQPERTFSLDALRVYSHAFYLQSLGRYEQAIPLYQRAIELDPRFAAAYVELATCYDGVHETVLSRLDMTRAYDLRDQADDFLRLEIITEYHNHVTGDLLA